MRKTLCLLGILGALLACGGGTSKKPCQDDQGCGRGFVCENGKCSVKPCNTDEDCGSSELMRVCTTIPEPGFDASSKYCTRIECNDTISCTDETLECVGNLCLPKQVPVDVPDAEELPTDALGAEEVTAPPQTFDCKPCQGDTDCGQGYSCMPLAGGKFCLKACTSVADCKGGYICYQVVSPGPKSCIPLTYKCVECAYEGCDKGKCCDFVSGECKDCKQKCDQCRYDFECAEGMRCYKEQANLLGNCVYECGQTGNCDEPDKFACQDTGQGIKLCVPTSPDSCASCPPEKPYLGPDNQCYQCLEDRHCKSGEVCDQQSHTCRSPDCPSGTYKCPDNQCHQCCEDSHCVGVPGASGKCINYRCEGAEDPCHGTCADPYPVCANVGGQWQCVQCAVDADCPFSNCKCSNYLCVDGTTGQVCASPSTYCAAQCTTDADCPPDSNGNTLACHQTYKVCYNPNGGCDGQVACCGPGHQCFDLIMLLFGGSPMPGMPPVMGQCSCNSQSDCLAGEPCTDISILCVIPIIGDMFCPGGSLPPTAPQKMCFDISKLLGGLGGF